MRAQTLFWRTNINKESAELNWINTLAQPTQKAAQYAAAIIDRSSLATRQRSDQAAQRTTEYARRNYNLFHSSGLRKAFSNLTMFSE